MDLDYNPSRKSLIKNKWVATVASIWIQCTSGSLYTFSIYSPVLKSSQGYDQSTLNTISVFKDLGANTGILSGLLYSTTVRGGRRGPWVVLLAGAAQCFLGYFLMWLTVTQVLPRPPVAVMCLYMLLAAHAMTFFNTANVVTGVHNFQNYAGTIVGIMKGFLGLGGAILILVYQTIFKDKPSSYLLMLAFLPTISSLLFMGFVRIYKSNEENEKRYLNSFSFLAVLLASYLTAVIIVDNILKLRLSIRVFTFVVLVLLLVSPVFVAIDAQREKSYRMIKSLLEHNQVTDDREDMTQIRQNEVSNGADQGTETSDDTLRRGDDLNLLQATCTISFWFLFITTACGMGSGLATVNNLAQIGGSLGYTNLEIDTLVSLWSIWNFLGRFGAGYISDYFLHAKGWPRPLFIAITLAAMSMGYVMVAFGFPGALYAGSVLVGVCYGSQWSLMPTIASEIFGKVHMGTIFNTITIAGPVGSYVLSVRIIGYFYDREASDNGKTCIGNHCFKLSFIIMASVTFLGSLFALALFFRTRNFYKHVILRRLLYSQRWSGLLEDTE
ncbi:protein NUCLEAR FUSION DEFECTIVE 4-like [Olea europaea var. sylvestris]|uniref:NUCLEAR FUSION DEFECTIVE 4-like n=1 Tax=Olea europaea subsp. europaea TaxID=158383 RepID=A0A8S0TJ08_OLEEU|nr:protein NUCLEAR FUSION DEFECTIVE 4-like [Olea europaea var. sylvestris]CAA3004549.1 NUCLEAR FUSION DEFECTIVE 4-like [Olea europaea subsp. europaea]